MQTSANKFTYNCSASAAELKTKLNCQFPALQNCHARLKINFCYPDNTRFCYFRDCICTILHIVGSKRYTALIASYAYDIITMQVYKVDSLVLSTILLVQSEKYFLLSTMCLILCLVLEKVDTKKSTNEQRNRKRVPTLQAASSSVL